MSVIRPIVTRHGSTWPKTDPGAIAPQTSRRVVWRGRRWTVALANDGKGITGRVVGVEKCNWHDGQELAESSQEERDSVVKIALDNL